MQILSRMISLEDFPIDLVINILKFDGRFRFSRGEIINKLDKNKYVEVIHFLLNKPLPHFRYRIIGLRQKSYDVSLSKDIFIQYNLNFNIHNEIEGLEINLWKRYEFLNKVNCN